MRRGPLIWTHDASPRHIQQAIEGSLKRLRLERIDVYQVHVPDPTVDFDATVETFARLKEQGKVRHVGLSNVTLEHLQRAEKIVPIVSVQNRYSISDREWDFVLDDANRGASSLFPGDRWDRGERPMT
jgi:aryl-alcohol dehydrogenase-like predicted oxidoreductase